jgi:bifunctional non-homologous end joining protein LigD
LLYIGGMLWRNSRGRPLNAPADFINPCQPIVAKQPPSGPGWAHELKHDGYRLQIHVRDGQVRLYTINGANWSKRYPLIVESAAYVQGSAILDAEVVWLDSDGVAQFDALHSRVNDAAATALAFDILMQLQRTHRGIQYVEHTEGHGDKMFEAVCRLGLEGIVSKKLNAPYRSGPSRTWIKVKNPNAPAATRALDGRF